MDKLKELVKALEAAKEEKEQIQILQKINRTLLTKYVIRIDDLIIEPLWVEAYYYDQKTFPDCNTHMSDKQKNRFNQVYFHEKGRGGLDVCLSLKDSYYLSILLKATLIYKESDSCDNKSFKKQTYIYDILHETNIEKMKIEKMKNVLVIRDRDCKVVNAVRINLQKPCFKDELLAACTLEGLDILEENGFDFPNGYKKQWKCSVCAISEISDEEKAREKAEEYNGSKIEDKYWKLAKESLGMK